MRTSVATSDTTRAGVVADFYTELADGLYHHTNEDEYLWPLLSPRAGTDRELVERGEQQHARVAELLTTTEPLCTDFRTNASAFDRVAFADVVEELGCALDERMADEERYVLPLVEVP